MNGMFQYRPLDPKHNELRLIRLCLPLSDGTAEKSKPLCCFLQHVSLDDDPTYIALSYVFGAAEPPSSLNVNGKSLRITNNLDVALRHLQKKVKSERLWIDAVCINQQDMEEKSVQIPRMLSIYQNANQVIAWLGEAGDDSELVLQKMSCMGEKVLACGTLQEILAGAEKEQIDNIARNVIIGQGDIMIAENKVFNLSAKCADIEISSFISLFKRRFWRRMWIMQEVAMARILHFVCGQASLSWHPFFAACWLLQQIQVPTGSRLEKEWTILKDAFSEANFFINGSYLYKSAYNQGNTKEPLRQLLEVARQHTCASDPKDMVFALSGLASDWEELGIETDYSRPYEDMYIEVARRYIEKGELSLLYQAQDRSLGVMTTLPSWAPDWSRPRSRVCLTNGFFDDRDFSASGTASSKPKFRIKTRQPKALLWLGVQVGEVASYGQVYNSKDMGSSFEAISGWLAEFEELSGPDMRGLRPSDEALWQTPIAMRKPQDPVWERRSERLHLAFQVLRGIIKPPDRAIEPEMLSLQYAEPYIYAMGRVADGRRGFTYGEACLGLGPSDIQVGDLVCILLGLEVPMILRKKPNGRYLLIGDAYAHGIMHGEYMEHNPRTRYYEIE